MRARRVQESGRSSGLPPRRPPVVPFHKGDGFIPLLGKEGLGEVSSPVRSMAEIGEHVAFGNRFPSRSHGHQRCGSWVAGLRSLQSSVDQRDSLSKRFRSWCSRLRAPGDLEMAPLVGGDTCSTGRRRYVLALISLRGYFKQQFTLFPRPRVSSDCLRQSRVI